MDRIRCTQPTEDEGVAGVVAFFAVDPDTRDVDAEAHGFDDGVLLIDGPPVLR